jgi:hypothetical protein
MPDRFFSLQDSLRTVLGALLLSHAALAPAQTLYRVELMVFAYPAGGATEQWEALPELAYPEGARLLIDPREQGGMPSTLQNAAQSSLPADPGVAPTSASEGYARLPASEREFGARAESMRGSGRYRILFHEAWLQPIPNQSTAVPVVLERSGGGWPELQGTITLYQAGDSVLETNLWLNTRGEYLPGTWRMPPPPRGPNTSAPTLLVATGESADSAGTAGDQAVDGFGDYPYRHAVLLQQSRRMRGSEVTYIDHPLLGVVAKISTIEGPATAPVEATEIPQSSTPPP